MGAESPQALRLFWVIPMRVLVPEPLRVRFLLREAPSAGWDPAPSGPGASEDATDTGVCSSGDSPEGQHQRVYMCMCELYTRILCMCVHACVCLCECVHKRGRGERFAFRNWLT